MSAPSGACNCTRPREVAASSAVSAAPPGRANASQLSAVNASPGGARTCAAGRSPAAGASWAVQCVSERRACGNAGCGKRAPRGAARARRRGRRRRATGPRGATAPPATTQQTAVSRKASDLCDSERAAQRSAARLHHGVVIAVEEQEGCRAAAAASAACAQQSSSADAHAATQRARTDGFLRVREGTHRAQRALARRRRAHAPWRAPQA
jgi:hypothetical protein